MRIAIDPGASGAIAWEHEGNVSVQKMPDTPTGIFECLKWMSGIGKLSGTMECQVERVGGYMPGNSGPAAVTFARHCGHIDMALIALDIRTLKPVGPTEWENAVCPGLPHYKPPKPPIPKHDKEARKAEERKKAAIKRKRKNMIKDRMQRLYPHLKTTLNTADALGILTYMLEHKP